MRNCFIDKLFTSSFISFILTKASKISIFNTSKNEFTTGIFKGLRTRKYYYVEFLQHGLDESLLLDKIFNVPIKEFKSVCIAM